MSAFRVLFVCVGNVCRSPFAERLLRLRLAEAGAASGDFEVTSAGTRSVEGAAMSPEMRVRLEALGGSGASFVARQLQPPLIEQSGLVLTATRDIRSRVLQEVPGALRRTFTVLELAELAPGAPHGASLSDAVRLCGEQRSSVSPERADVSDPINRSDAVHDRVAAQLDEAITAISSLLVENIPDDPSHTTGTRIAR